MRWIREHKLIAALLALLLVLVIIFVISISSGQGNNSVSDTVNQGTNGISGFLSSMGEGIRENVTGLFSHKQMQERIEELEAENERLQLELSAAKLNKSQLEQLKDLSAVLGYNYVKKGHKVVTADVTLIDKSTWNGVFTIDRGTEAGIKKGKIVVNGSGLVGKVTAVGEGWAQVTSVIDSGTKVSFKLSRSNKQLGVVSGDSKGKLSGYMLDNESTVTEGDIIVTSGMGFFPEGLEVGSVRSVVNNSDTLIKEVTVDPAVDFNSLRKVSVIL